MKQQFTLQLRSKRTYRTTIFYSLFSFVAYINLTRFLYLKSDQLAITFALDKSTLVPSLIIVIANGFFLCG